MKIKVWTGFLLLFFVFQAQSIVDTKNANYTKTFVDISFTGSGLPLMVERTYNSRSLYHGLFGYGWCSNLETRLEVMPDNTLMIVECGAGVEISYVSKDIKINNSIMIKKIMAQVRKKKNLTKQYIRQVEKDLKKSALLRSELIRAFNLEGKATPGQKYQAVGRQNDSISFTGSRYKRTSANGQIQIFNKNGELVKELDKFGNWISFQRRKAKLVKVIDNRGRSLLFREKNGKLTISGSNKITAEYLIKSDNLVRVVNSKAEKYIHLYDAYHNLTKNRYPDNSYEILTYNTDKDWVISFKDRRGCLEKYGYNTNKRNKDHYWTDVRKTCGKRVTNISRYEFWNKRKKDGSKYLYRAKQKVNGRIADITYDLNTGSPLSVTRNRITTRYTYYPQGFLKSRSESSGKVVLFSNYDSKCKKPRTVLVRYKKGNKVKRKIHTQISYDKSKCKLIVAKQSTGRWVKVKRDTRGRIREMRDQSKKIILVTYNEVHSKPSKITRPGVGFIQVVYNKDGQVNPSKSKLDPIVATQVANVFNGFLEIISPVAANITI